MTVTLGDLYPTCLRCGGECVALRCCNAHPAPFQDSNEDSDAVEYVPCPECNGLGGRLTHGGKLLLEIMRLSNPSR